MDKFEQVAEDVHMDEDTFRKLTVTKERKDHSEYPTKTYKHLFGFKTWKPKHLLTKLDGKTYSDYDAVADVLRDVKHEVESLEQEYSTGGLGLFCNIERFAIPYGTDPQQILEFYARISEATEPFVVWHSNQEHHPTNLYEMDKDGIEEEVVYRIECRDGQADLYEVEFERAGEEKIEEFRSKSTEEGDR